jgi:hypothetical protein
MAMLFDHIRQWHCIIDEVFDVEEQTVLVLIQIVDTNGTLEPMLDSGKSNRADGAVVAAASLLLVSLIIIVLLLGCLLLSCLLLDCLLLGHLLPRERDNPFQLFNPHF